MCRPDTTPSHTDAMTDAEIIAALVKLAEDGNHPEDSEHGDCLFCDGCPERVAARNSEHGHHYVNVGCMAGQQSGHEPDCPWLAILKRAGLGTAMSAGHGGLPY